MIIIGDGIHNIADGLAIGAAFAENVLFGVTTTIAIACHELPTELGEYMVLIESGFTFRRALLFNFISACTAIAGFFIGASIAENESARIWIFVITAGTFTYIALVDLVSAESLSGSTRWSFDSIVVADTHACTTPIRLDSFSLCDFWLSPRRLDYVHFDDIRRGHCQERQLLMNKSRQHKLHFLMSKIWLGSFVNLLVIAYREENDKKMLKRMSFPVSEKVDQLNAMFPECLPTHDLSLTKRRKLLLSHHWWEALYAVWCRSFLLLREFLGEHLSTPFIC